MSRRWVAIVNPTSGRGLTASTLSGLVSRLRGVADPVVITEYRGHARQLVRKFRNAEGVVVAGGDGTIFDVLQTLRRDQQEALVVPTGRGNSLARDLGALSTESALAATASGKTITIDLLAVSLVFDDGRRWRGVSASTLALGYPADVANLATRYLRWMGRHSYPLAAPVIRPSAMTMRLSCDGEPWAWRAGTGLIINNTRHVGPFEAFPEANLADGLCDVMELQAGWCVQNMHNLSVLAGWHLFRPARVRRARTVTVEVDRPTVVKLDGELRPEVRRLEVNVLPAALACRVPGGAHV